MSLLLVEKTVGWKEALFEEKIMLAKLAYFAPRTIDDYALYAVFLFEVYVVVYVGHEALFG